jgi:hypothetical protein
MLAGYTHRVDSLAMRDPSADYFDTVYVTVVPDDAIKIAVKFTADEARMFALRLIRAADKSEDVEYWNGKGNPPRHGHRGTYPR